MGMLAVSSLLLVGPWMGCADADFPFGPEMRGDDAPRVEEPATPAAPAASPELYRNEPAGFMRLTERHFEAREDDGWRATDSRNFGIATDVTAPVSEPTVGEVRFPAGMRGGSSPIWTEREISRGEATSLYVSFWLKVSDNFQGHPVNSKIIYFLTHGKPVVFPVYIGRDDQPLSTEVRIQDTPEGSRNFRPNLGDRTIERGEWVQWEILLVHNTNGRANGEIHWWIDGHKLGSYDDVRFGSASQNEIWERVSWRPVWGGQGGEVRQDMYMWMDRFYASGTR